MRMAVVVAIILAIATASKALSQEALGNLPPNWGSQMKQHWLNNPGEIMDLKDLGIEKPDGSVNLYLRYRDSELQDVIGIVNPDPMWTVDDTTKFEVDDWMSNFGRKKGEAIIPIPSTHGGQSLSDPNHYIRTALYHLCRLKIQANQATLTLEAKIPYLMTGSASLTYDLTTTCPKVVPPSTGSARVSDADKN